MTFTGLLGPDGKPRGIPDTFVFDGGTFVSNEYELRCDYPARRYSTRQNETGWSFISTTRRAYKDATFVWRCTIEGDQISGIATWTMRRLYWTIERDFELEATVAGATDGAVDGSRMMPHLTPGKRQFLLETTLATVATVLVAINLGFQHLTDTFQLNIRPNNEDAIPRTIIILAVLFTLALALAFVPGVEIEWG